MTQVIINDILPLTQAIASGGQTVYSTNWTANAASDVVVYSRASGVAANDVTQILSPSQYSVAFIGGSLTVQVTLVTPSTAGDMVTILRQTPANRENLYTNTNFTPSMINNDIGILTLVDQQSQLVNSQVGPRYNYSEFLNIPTDTILPILGANQLWIKNPTNTAIIAATISGGGSGSGGVNPGLQNQVAWYATNGNVVSGLPTANNSVLVTSSAGVPSLSTILPSGLTIPGYAHSGANADITSMSALTGYLAAPLGFKDALGNIGLLMSYTASAVNYMIFFNSATGNPVTISTAGTDSAVPIGLGIKGGELKLYDGLSVASGKLRFYNAAFTNFTGLTVATNQATSIDFKLPPSDGTALAPLVTDGSGNLSFLPGPYTNYAGTITYTGFSGTPTTNIAKYKQIGKTVFVVIDMTGTSNATGFTFSLPIVAGTTGATIAIARATDNGSYSSSVYGTIGNGASTVGLVISDNGAGWTNTGTKSVRCSFFYETA